MLREHKNTKGYIKKFKNDYHIFNDFYDTLLLYSKKYEYFDGHSDGAHELIFNNSCKYSDAYGFISLLIFYGLLYCKKGDKKVYFDKNLYLLKNLDNFLFILENNLSLQEYSRYKKLNSIINDIKH